MEETKTTEIDEIELVEAEMVIEEKPVRMVNLKQYWYVDPNGNIREKQTDEVVVSGEHIHTGYANYIVYIHNQHIQRIENKVFTSKDELYSTESFLSSIKIKNRLEEYFHQEYINIFSPLLDNSTNDESIDKLIKSRFIVSEIDPLNVDHERIMMELGIACGINYILDDLSYIVDLAKSKDQVFTKVIDLIHTIPRKTILAYKDYNFVLDEYVLSNLEKMGTIHNNFDHLLRELESEIQRDRE